MTEGEIATWHAAVGDQVNIGQAIADIETAKATTVYEATSSGALRRRLADEGEAVQVGGLFGIIADPSVSESRIDEFIERFRISLATATANTLPEPSVLDAGGRHIRYLRSGDPGRPVVVLLHGFGGDLGSWALNQGILSESMAVYSIDLPGHGGSTKEVGTGDIPGLASAINDFLVAAEIDQAHLVGHSLGGGSALYLALEHPTRVASLTLIAPLGLSADINEAFITDFVAAERRNEVKSVLERLFSDPALISREMIADVLKYKRIDGVQSALRSIADAAFHAGRQTLILTERLAELGMPAQVLWGADDRIIRPPQASSLPRTIASHILEGGHMVHVENAKAVNRLIIDFVRESESDRK